MEMLPFRIHRMEIAGRQYLLLPKLNQEQMKAIAGSLEQRGYSVRFASTLSAKSGGKRVHIDPSGICWSSVDPEDAVVPAIPELLSCPKEKIPLPELTALYFKTTGSGKEHAVKMSVRLESSAVWDSLRASDGCGLAPDEHAIALSLIANAKGACRLLTDFPGERPNLRILGRRRYFESTVSSEEAGETLRVTGSRASRNSYLPRDGVLRLSGRPSLLRQELERVLEGLDEWCSFSPL